MRTWGGSSAVSAKPPILWVASPERQARFASVRVTVAGRALARPAGDRRSFGLGGSFRESADQIGLEGRRPGDLAGAEIVDDPAHPAELGRPQVPLQLELEREEPGQAGGAEGGQ